MMKHPEKRRPDMYADPDEPWLGVHTLSEFAFCPRAGICSHDQSATDDGEELSDRPGFYHLPIFFIEEMTRCQKELAVTLRIGMWFGFILLIGLVIAGVFLHPIFFIAAMFCGVISLIGFITQTVRIAEVSRVMQEWDKANSEVPDVDIAKPTKIHWPNFIVAGYKPENLQHAMEEDNWKLRGKPWRMLRYGKLAIPVFLRNVTEKSAANQGDSETPYLYPQHYVRIAAYCHLIEKSEGLRVPYGIVLTRGSLTGVAIPNTQPNQETLIDAVADARRTMRDVGNNPQECPSADPRHCVGCPYGNPDTTDVRFPCRKSNKDQNPNVLKPYFVSSRYKDKEGEWHERRFHSHCGDRFVWLPPHDNAAKLKLEE